MQKIFNGNELKEIDYQGSAQVIETPVTEKYCNPGDKVKIENRYLKIGGVYFEFDYRWEFEIN